MSKNQTVWTEQDEHTLTELWNNGMSVRLIAARLNKTPASVKMYRQRYGDRLQLNKREFVRVGRAKSQNPSFDKEWYGCVPCGHWLITKPWRTET